MSHKTSVKFLYQLFCFANCNHAVQLWSWMAPPGFSLWGFYIYTISISVLFYKTFWNLFKIVTLQRNWCFFKHEAVHSFNFGLLVLSPYTTPQWQSKLKYSQNKFEGILMIYSKINGWSIIFRDIFTIQTFLWFILALSVVLDSFHNLNLSVRQDCIWQSLWQFKCPKRWQPPLLTAGYISKSL